eukprot:2641726-Pyramimonas_sp.AAC.1
MPTQQHRRAQQHPGYPSPLFSITLNRSSLVRAEHNETARWPRCAGSRRAWRWTSPCPPPPPPPPPPAPPPPCPGPSRRLTGRRTGRRL